MDYYNTKKEKLIEEIKKLKKENDLFRASEGGSDVIFERSSELLIVINSKGKIININTAAKNCFGIGDFEKEKSTINEFHCSDGTNLKDVIVNSVTNGSGSFRQDVRIKDALVNLEGNVFSRNNESYLCILKAADKDIQSSAQTQYLDEAHYELLENLDTGLNIIGKDFRIKFSNKAAKEIHPEVRNFLNRRCYDLFSHSKEDEPCKDCPVALLFEDGKTHKKVIQSGDIKQNKMIQIIASPITGKNGEIIGAFELVKDLSDNFSDTKENDKTLFTKKIINTLPVPVFVKDLKGNYIVCNNEFAGFLQKEGKDIEGKNEFELFDKDLADKFEKSDAEVITKGISEQVVKNFCKPDDKSRCDFLLKKTLYYGNNEIKGIYGTVIDITETIRYQDELTQQKNFIYNIIEDANVMIIGLDLKGNITLFNKMAENITGYSREDILGKNYFEYIVPKNSFPKVYESFINFSRSKVIKYENYENYIRTKSGTEKFISWRDSVTILNNKVTGITSFGIDLTNSQYEKELLRKLSLAVNETSSAIIIANKSGSIGFVNPAFTKITGYTLDEVEGKDDLFLKGMVADSGLLNEIIEKINSGETWYGELQSKRKNGEVYWESNSISPVKDENGRITDFITIKNEITDYKASIDNLKLQKEKAEESGRLKNSLISNFSREFTNPLISILGYTEILQNELNDAWHLEMLNDINKRGKKLLKTISLISKLSNLETENNKINFQKCNLVKIFDELIPEFNTRTSIKGLDLLYPDNISGIFVKSDVLIIKEIISNLLENSIRNTNKGTIKLEFGKAADNDKCYAVLTITDTGTDIMNSRSGKSEFSGNETIPSSEEEGFTLYISSNMARLLNGSLTYDSKAGIGSRYILKIPLSEDDEFSIEHYLKAGSSDETAEIISAVTKSKPAVLLVEDNLSNVNIIEIFLQNLFDIDSTTTGEEAIAKSAAKNYELIIMDINLGMGINGITTLNEIRKNKYYDKIPVIAVTGYALVGDREKLINAGFNEYLAKPFTRKQLVYVIKKFL